MSRAAVFVLLVGATAGAAPVPKDVQTEEQLQKVYGTRADEKKRAKFALRGDRLVIALGAHVEEPDDPLQPPRQPATPLESPRVTREVSGDFVARVGVKCPQPPTPAGLVHAYMGGGIVVVLGDGHYFAAERSHVLRYDNNAKLIWDGSFEATVRRFRPALLESSFSSHRASTDPLFISLTRRGDTFTVEYSADGKKWDVLKSIKQPAPEKLRVGLFARHNTNEPVDIAFADYTLTKPESSYHASRLAW